MTQISKLVVCYQFTQMICDGSYLYLLRWFYLKK
jgi:hypothetical protein